MKRKGILDRRDWRNLHFSLPSTKGSSRASTNGRKCTCCAPKAEVRLKIPGCDALNLEDEPTVGPAAANFARNLREISTFSDKG